MARLTTDNIKKFAGKFVACGKPIDRAFEILGSRLMPGTDGCYYLDNNKVSQKAVIIEANKVAIKRNLPLIAYPGVGEPVMRFAA